MYVTCVLVFITPLSLQAKDRGDGTLYFSDLYYTSFTSFEEAEKAKDSDHTGTLLEYANFYFIAASQMPQRSQESAEYSEIAFDVYLKVWKNNFSDPRIQTLMATAYASQGNNPNLNLQNVVEYVFRARNLYTMVLDVYPGNLDACLGRIRINMNLTVATGRPNDIHRADVENFFRGYALLPEFLKSNPYFRNGLMEVYLARALLYEEAGEYSLAKKDLLLIEPELLHEHARKQYSELKNKVEKMMENNTGRTSETN